MELTNVIREPSIESTIATALRYSLYTFGILLFTASLPWVAQYREAAAFKENGAIEWLQFGILVAISLMFLREAFVTRRFQQIFVLLACFSAFAGVREMDANLDKLIPWVGWKFGYLLILYAGFVVYSNTQTLRRQITPCLNSRGFLLLWAGFIVAIPFAQLVGNGAFLQAIMTDDYSRDYRRMIEEIGELMGYGLLLIGSYEMILQTRMTLKWDEFAASYWSNDIDV